ncbi:MAG: toll/interleukin-1 receptor domain-containing protein [Gemmatimonadales bacterium]
MTADAFVSHSSNDKGVALALVSALEAAGIRCWIAPRDIRPGDLWAQAIVEAIESCRVLVVVHSASADKSGHVLNEVDTAVRAGRHVLPVRTDDSVAGGALGYHLRSRHWIDAPNLVADPGQAAPVVRAAKALLALPPGAPPTEREMLAATGRDPSHQAPKAAPVAKPATSFSSTDTSILIRVPRMRRPRWRRRWIAAAAGAGLLLAVAGYLSWGHRAVIGVEFEVGQATAGSDWRLTVRSDSLRFFEGPNPPPARNQRNFGAHFTRAQARYLYAELRIAHEAPGRLLHLPIICSVYRPDGGLLANLTLENRIQAQATSWINQSGWGRATPGSWEPGRYRVDCSYDRTLVARDWFEVLD